VGSMGRSYLKTNGATLHMAFKLPCIYDCITKLCRQQAEVIQITKMQLFATLDKANRDTGYIRGLTLAAVNHTTVQVNRLLLQQELLIIGQDLLY
jgi:hypothetical protein